jgi:hypothetical protein
MKRRFLGAVIAVLAASVIAASASASSASVRLVHVTSPVSAGSYATLVARLCHPGSRVRSRSTTTPAPHTRQGCTPNGRSLAASVGPGRSERGRLLGAGRSESRVAAPVCCTRPSGPHEQIRPEPLPQCADFQRH